MLSANVVDATLLPEVPDTAAWEESFSTISTSISPADVPGQFDDVSETVVKDPVEVGTGRVLENSLQSSHNDAFANREDLGSVGSVTTTGSNVGFTGEASEPPQSGTINSAWWSWTAPSNGTLVVDTNGSNYDTYLTLATGSAVNSLSVLDQDDDGGAGLQSLITSLVTLGTEYQIAVDGFDSATGSITLNVSFTPTPVVTGEDFGDAPGPYPTLIADNGAQHTLTGSTLFLGVDRDGETNGQPDANALGDDNANNDEDGVVFNDVLETGDSATVTVTASQAGGVLNGWVDWNQNGFWQDAGEQVFTDQALLSGANSLSIAVPAGAALGQTFSRFRISTATGLAPTGATADGEVEDYQVTVQTAQNRINWVNRGLASDNFDSTFGAAVNLARGVIDAVIASWERVITNFNQPGGGDQINITLSMNSGGTGFGASAGATIVNGFPTAGSITVSRGSDTTGDGLGDGAGYFLDPTPLDNTEFAGTLNQGAFVGNAHAGSPALGLSDLFTLVNAEITHALGLFLSPALSNNPLIGTVTATGVTDDSEGGGVGTYRVFDGPSVTHLFTSNNGGGGGSDTGQLVHSAGPPSGPNQPLAFNSATRGPLQLVGANGPGNAVYEFSRRYMANDVMALFFQDAYGYSITLPQTFGTTYASLNDNTGELLIRGGLGGSTDVISVTLNGSDVEVSVNIGNDIAGTGPNGDASDIAAFVSRFPASSVSSVTIQADDGDDQISVAPLVGIPITIDGGTPAFPNGGVGDELTFNVTGVTGVNVTDNGNGTGSLTSTTHGTVTWSEIEVVTNPMSIASIIDNGEAGFSTVGSWNPVSNPSGHAGDLHHTAAGSGARVARWEFTGLTPGNYRVWATWVEHVNRATNSPFTALDAVGGNFLNIKEVNQELPPSGLTADGSDWSELYVVEVTGSTLVIELDDAADGYVIADAIRIEATTDPITPKPIPGNIIDNDDLGFATVGNWVYATTASGHDGDLHHSAAGVGNDKATWTFTGLTPGNYLVSATWFAYANRAADAPFRILDGTGGAELASVEVNQKLAPDDFSDAGSNWENLTIVTITGTELVVELSDDASQYVVADAIRLESTMIPPPPIPTIIDNGDPGFSATAGWNTPPAPVGHEGDLLNTTAGDGSRVATWTFNDLTPGGTYRVSATWTAHDNRATDAPFTIYDGAVPLQTIEVNQELVPDDFSDAGSSWEDLVTVTITGSTLVVELSNAANGYVIADAIRIVPVA